MCVFSLCFYAFPFFTAAVILEFFILLLQGKNEHWIFYMFNNISRGFLQQAIKKLFNGPIMFIAYLIGENIRRIATFMSISVS